MNGIDRYDNEQGYVISNVRPCCYECNMFKRNRHGDDYIAKAIKYSKATRTQLVTERYALAYNISR